MLLFMDMLERVGFLIALAFVFSRSRWMRKYMDYYGERRNQWKFILFFALYSILGTYSGVQTTNYSYQALPFISNMPYSSAIANTRSVGVVIAGLLGGIKTGAIVGAIAGIHRYSLGGFVAVPCGLAPIMQGIFAGVMQNALKKRVRHNSSVGVAFIIGFFAEAIQMLLILLLASPWENALKLVLYIGIPQTLTCAVGVAAFFMLHIQMDHEEERIRTIAASTALKIADRTLPYWKKPFKAAIEGVAHILVSEAQAVGVFFHQGEEMIVQEGRRTKNWIDMPLSKESKVQIGLFHLYYNHKEEINEAKQKQLHALGQLLSQQYAFVESGRQSKLLADAEIRSLQAQMNPHFLFNVLNTVMSFIRTKPEKARKMIQQLATFLRKNLQHSNRTLICISDELDMVRAYLNLMKVRMGDHLEIRIDIDDSVLHLPLPPFTIQPLVENSIIHGLKSLDKSGLITVSVKAQEKGAIITVEDNGVGMGSGESEIAKDHLGFALYNVEQRLRYHLGMEKVLQIESVVNTGTKVSFKVW